MQFMNKFNEIFSFTNEIIKNDNFLYDEDDSSESSYIILFQEELAFVPSFAMLLESNSAKTSGSSLI